MGHPGVAAVVETSQLETNYALSALQSVTRGKDASREDVEEPESVCDYVCELVTYTPCGSRSDIDFPLEDLSKNGLGIPLSCYFLLLIYKYSIKESQI